MPRYADDDKLDAELEAVIERHIGSIMSNATTFDETTDFEMPVLTAFVCGFEIADAAHDEGRWYIHRTSTKRVSPVHINGILNEMLNNWNLDDD